MSLVQMLGFHVWFEHFHCLSDTPRVMDNGRDGHRVACQTFGLVCTEQRLRHVRLAAELAGVTSPTHIGHVVVRETCRNYM